MQPTNPECETLWQLPPHVQAALDDANARLAALANKHAPPTTGSQQSPRLAQELIAWGQFKLQPTAVQLLTPDVTSAAFYQNLVAHDCLADARRVLAHSLPKRRALWWGMLAAWDAYRHAPPENLREVLQVVTQFVITPTEDLRRALGEWSQRCPCNTIAGCLASAAFFSAGSVSPAGLPPVAPQAFITGRLVGVCVYLAAVTRSAALYKQYLREYLRWGSEIASGNMLWAAPASAEQASSSISRIDAFWDAPQPHIQLSKPITNAMGAST